MPERVSSPAASESIESTRKAKAPLSSRPALVFKAGAGIEPANSGFADRSLTTWLPRHQRKWRVTRDLTVSMSRDIRREKAGECTGERCTNSRTTSRELLWWFYDGLSWFRVIADHPE